MYINKLEETVNKYNNTYQRTIKAIPVNVKTSKYIDSIKDINDKDPKFKIGHIVRISKHKNNFAKGYVPNWSEEVFVIKKLNNTVPCTYVISDLKGKETVGAFHEKEMKKKKIKKSLELKN